jgi:hypothetical protein
MDTRTEDTKPNRLRFRNILTMKKQKMAALTALAVAGVLTGAVGYAPDAHAQSQPPNAAPAAPTETQDASSANDASALAKKLQNPIGDLYSFPFQNNTNFNTGPHKGTQDILNVQPVIPIHINSDWTVITRTILPLVWQPSLQPAQTVPFGTGPTTFSAFLSPANPVDGWLWGVGPVVQIPTISDKSLGSNVWGGGPTGVLVYMKGPIVAGALVNNVWSFGGTPGLGGTRYNSFLTQPFFNYNFGEGWYAGSAPIITANWLTGGNKWTLPVGAQVGRVVKIGGKLPVNFLVGAYYNALRPEFGATWQLRTQMTLIF